MPLKHAQRKRNSPRGSRLAKGKPFAYPAGIMVRYESAILTLVRKMTKETKAAVKSFYKKPVVKATFDSKESDAIKAAKALTDYLNNRFEELFSGSAFNIADSMLNEVDEVSGKSTRLNLKQASKLTTIDLSSIDKGTQSIIKASVIEGANLIKSIPQQYMDRVKEMITDSITKGHGLAELIPNLENIDGMSDRRAKNIAYDQTRKAYAGLNLKRSLNVGVTQGEWIHSGGSDHPRETHEEMDGEIFDLDEGLFDEDVGDYVLPAELPYCGCSYTPIIPEEADEPEEAESD